jgi:hypothetical protein
MDPTFIANIKPSDMDGEIMTIIDNVNRMEEDCYNIALQSSYAEAEINFILYWKQKKISDDAINQTIETDQENLNGYLHKRRLQQIDRKKYDHLKWRARSNKKAVHSH